MRWSRFGLLPLLALVVSGAALTAGLGHEADLLEQDSLWVASPRGVAGLSLGDGGEAVLIQAPGAQRILADQAAGRVWILSSSTVSAFDPAGVELFRSRLPGAAGAVPRAVLRPADHSLWIASGSRLIALGAGGQLLREQTFPAPIQALAFSPSPDLLWIVSGGALSAFDAVTLQEVASRALSTKASPIGLAVDPLDGALWIAWPNRVRRYRADGRTDVEAAAPGLQLVEPDGHGGAWLATDTTLTRLDAAGRLAMAASPLPAAGVIEALAADPADGSVWIGGSRSLVQVDRSGSVRTVRPFPGGPVRDLAIARGAQGNRPPPERPAAPKEKAAAATARPSNVGALTSPDTAVRTVTFHAASDSYLKEGTPNQNLGGESLLRIRSSGPNRALVRFDPDQIAAALAGGTLVSARLEMQIASNGGNWGDGRTIGVHRLTTDWTESGVTWDCPADAVPTNSRPDCAVSPAGWDGGSFAATATDSVLHTNASAGRIAFDVTADVAAQAAGAPHYGWLLKKTQEGQNGLVDYASREVCGEEPRLVLEVASAAPDVAPPVLRIDSPSERFLINQPAAPIALSFFDAGSAIDPGSLAVRLDGVDVTATCTVCSSGAVCPWPALAEGPHTVSAGIADAGGHLAETSFPFDLLLGDGEHRVTLPVAADTYVRNGSPNQNQGGESLLRIRSSGKNRALARFDLAGLEDAVDDLHSATLELYVETNGGNWGTAGRTIDAHRLTADWTETGATWNCADDTVPGNQNDDCAAGWNGGTFATPPSASVLQTNSLTGWVGFDVTADVLSQLAGQPHQGWLVKKRDEGQNGLVEYTSKEGTAGKAPRLVLVFDGGAPVDLTPPSLAITAPAAGSTIDDATPTIAFAWSDAGSGVVPGSLAARIGGSPVALSCTFGPAAAVCEPFDPLPDGAVVLTATVADAAGNVSAPAAVQFTIDTSPPEPQLPPDPSTVAPPLDRTVATDVFAATAFLYTGASPIQTGVAPGTIDPRRVAVLRGRVLDREGSALPGVTVAVHDHPELGGTLSRIDDGQYDLVVNGGGPLVLDYRKAGHLPAQRPVPAPVRDYALVDDVALVPYDEAVTPILAGQPGAQVARGGTVTDDAGTRRSTLLFQPGTTASLVLPDGSVQPLAALSMRSTEYSVGSEGLTAMPAPLPPNTGYTYAVELSADEAVAAGAVRVELSQPAVHYLENFLGFPVGGAVPTGYYDRALAGWVPSGNGRVVRVLGASAGLADLDVDGSGQPGGPQVLAGLGVTPEEREAVAQLYAPGQSLWRVPIPHLTPWDHNWPSGPPLDAVPPPDPYAEDDQQQADTEDDSDDEDENDCEAGSILECQSQVLREDVALDGTPLRLHYGSDRVPGRGAPRFRKIRVIGDNVPPSLKEIGVEVVAAGKRIFLGHFAPVADQVARFTWDGKDAYGRTVQGSVPVTITTTYRYSAVYYARADDASRVSSFSRLPVGGAIALRENRDGGEYDLRRTFVSTARDLSHTVGYLDWRELGLGGWSLSPHHFYDPVRRALYPGHGGRRSADPLGHFLINVAGTGTHGSSGDGGAARRGELASPWGIARAADGTLYAAENTGHRIRRISPEGILSTVAGTGERCPWDIGGADHCGDGGPALQARLSDPRGIALAPDGRLYIADAGNRCVRRIEPDGRITTVVGLCEGVLGDGGQLTTPGKVKASPAFAVSACPAGSLCRPSETALERPTGLAFDRDGGLYLSDSETGLVLFVGLDGLLSVVAGGGEPADFIGDGLPAAQAVLYSPADLALAPDGTLLIAESGHGRVRRVGLDGIIRTAAGIDDGVVGDGGLATETQLFGPKALAVAADGSFFFSEEGGFRIRSVSPEGRISTVAGVGQVGFGTVAPDGTAALRLQLGAVNGLVLSPDGTLLFSDSDNHYAGSLATDLSGFTNEDLFLASEDGSEVYVFDPKGRHLRTRNALTGADLFVFRYTAEGLLSEIEAADGNLTRIERDALGLAKAVIAPFGQRTELEMGPDGYLKTISDPAHLRKYGFVYNQGLMTGRTDPREDAYTYNFDLLGRLTGYDDPAGGAKTLTRQGEGDQDYTVTLDTALGRHTEYRVSASRSLQTRLRTEKVGPTETIVTAETKSSDGTRVTALPDGTVITLREGPDAAWGATSRRGGFREIRTPSGLTSITSIEQGAELADLEDPFSLVSRFQNVTVNGETYLATYDAPTRTFTWQTPEGRTSTAQTDELGRLVNAQINGLAPVLWDYDSHGRLIQIRQGTGSEERTVVFSYSPDGRFESATDPLGRSVSVSYDPLGRLATLVYPDGREAQFVYDATGNLVALSPPGRPAHGYQYTPVDLESQYIPPVVGVDSTSTGYTYDADRKLTQILQPGDRDITIAYGQGGRPTELVTHRGATSVTYRSGTRDPLTVTTPEGNGITYGYDGHLLTSTGWSGEITGSVQRSYDTTLRLVEERINGGNAVTFSYDRDGLISSAGTLAVTRDATRGVISGTSLGSVTTAAEYNNFAEPTSASADFAGTSLWRVNYTRDKLGRILEKMETIEGVTDTFVYQYDLAGRLTRVDKNGTLFSEYAYDANGNRLSYTGTLGSASGVYDDQDRLLTYGDIAYTYTANGELATKTQNGQTVAYHYDEMGNLLDVDLPAGIEVDYVVDGRSRRIGKKVNGVLVQGLLYRDQLEPVAELDGSGQIVARFVYGSRLNIPDYMEKGGKIYRIVSDHLGSPRLVVDTATGVIAQRMDYDEFGNVILDTNPRFQPFGFAGGLHDTHTGLVRFGARDYDSGAGRWTTKDPIGFKGGEGNLYGYVANDPVNFLDDPGLMKLPADPTGLSPEWIKDPTHRNPGGEQYKGPGGDILEWHRGRPGQQGAQEKDHWHHYPGGQGQRHRPLVPGTEIPDPISGPGPSCKFVSEVDYEWPIAVPIGIGIIVATIVEDVMTGGIGLADDPATLAFGLSLVLGGGGR